jgi:hypothetical protein
MAADTDALNYPYIRIRSADWLKRTLLIFPHVVRMTPNLHAPADDPDVQQFCERYGRRGPLLRSAQLWEPHVRSAQEELIEQLEAFQYERGAGLFKRFGQHCRNELGKAQTAGHLTVWERRLPGHYPSFQIHRHKMLPKLVEYLQSRRLAWEPYSNYSHGSDYLEMNPVLGEAVMATLAVACAENEGLSVVTEFPKLHGNLIGIPRDKILAACLDGPTSSGRTSYQQVAEFLVYRRCNVDDLTAERIAALKSERDLLAKFREKLEVLAATLPPTIHSEQTTEQRLNDLLSDMFDEWQADQNNLSNFARRVFGEGALKEPGQLIQKLVEAATNRENLKPAAAAAGAAGAVATHVGGLTTGIATASAAGFVVAILFHSASAFQSTVKTARESPLRYLTTLQNEGVSFSMTRDLRSAVDPNFRS